MVLIKAFLWTGVFPHRSQLLALVLHLNSILDATSSRLWVRRSEKWYNQSLVWNCGDMFFFIAGRCCWFLTDVTGCILGSIQHLFTIYYLFNIRCKCARLCSAWAGWSRLGLKVMPACLFPHVFRICMNLSNEPQWLLHPCCAAIQVDCPNKMTECLDKRSSESR